MRRPGKSRRLHVDYRGLESTVKEQLLLSSADKVGRSEDRPFFERQAGAISFLDHLVAPIEFPISSETHVSEVCLCRMILSQEKRSLSHDEVSHSKCGVESPSVADHQDHRRFMVIEKKAKTLLGSYRSQAA